MEKLKQKILYNPFNTFFSGAFGNKNQLFLNISSLVEIDRSQRIGFNFGYSPDSVFDISAIILFCEERLLKSGNWIFAASNEDRICFLIAVVSIKCY